MSSELKLGYFNFFGRGQICRLLLAYTKTEFKQITYSFSRINQWIQIDKIELGLQFPSLPYLIDGNFKLTQSRAIELYIIQKAKRIDLLGKNNKQSARISNIQGVLRDVFNAITQLFFVNNQYDQTRKKTYQTISPKMSYLDSYIGSNNGFFNRITYPDFILTVLFQFYKLFYPHEYQKYKNIIRVVGYINQLDQIKAYYKKPQSITKIVAPQRQNDLKFKNLNPIFQTFKQDHQQIISLSLPIAQSNQQNLGQTQKQKNILFQSQSLKTQQEKTEKKSQTHTFQDKVQQFLKVAKKDNSDKVHPQINFNNQKTTIITPSKISASKNQQSSSTPWKLSSLNNQTVDQNDNLNKRGSIILGYWGIRGLAQINRHLLSYCQVQFSQKLYLTPQEWFNGDKNSLNLPFPNLPYIIQGDFKLTQSLAINRYIINISQKKDLLGINLRDQMLIENTVKILSDLFKQIRDLCFTEDKQKKKSDQLSSKLLPVLQKISSLSDGKRYALGYISLIDFYMSQISFYIQNIFPELFGKFQFLKIIRDALKQDPLIQNYYKRQFSVKGPFMPPTALISF